MIKAAAGPEMVMSTLTSFLLRPHAIILWHDGAGGGGADLPLNGGKGIEMEEGAWMLRVSTALHTVSDILFSRRDAS